MSEFRAIKSYSKQAATRRILFIYLFICLLMAINPASAYISTNIQWLYGNRYQPDSSNKQIITVEHSQSWSKADIYAFVDYGMPEDADNYYYFEPTLRYQLHAASKSSAKGYGYKSLLLSGNFEKPRGKDIRNNLGFSIDFTLPRFAFFKTNYWYRDNPDQAGSSWQFTLAWKYQQRLLKRPFIIEGFTDIVGAEGDLSSYQILVPRFLFDISQDIGLADNTLWLGIEWQYWHNKHGVDGVTESVPQLQVKWNLY